jgi:DNA-binding beta-propeller fold protein YncE
MPSASVPARDPFEEIPSFGVSTWAALEVDTALAPEAISVRADGIIELFTADDVHAVSLAGKLLGSSSSRRGRGADGYFSSAGEWISASVLGSALMWPGPFEQGAAILDATSSATGLGMASTRDHCEGCIYVADGATKSVTEYVETGRSLRTLSLPDTDPQGVAVARSGRVYIADAARRRLLRSDAELTAIDGVATLPVGNGDVPSGLAFDADEHLYVCFRDVSTLLVLAFDDEP